MWREQLAQREGPSVGLHRLVRHVLTGVVRLVAHELVDARLHLGRHAGEGEATPGGRRAAERAARGGTAEASSTPRHQGISPRTVGFGDGRVPVGQLRSERGRRLLLGGPGPLRGVGLLQVGQHLGVARLGAHQLRVGPVGDDVTALEQHDALGEVDGRDAMGDHERGAALHQHLERRVDLLLDLHVDRAGGVVEHEDGGVVEQRARDGDALPLATRQRVAALTHLAVEAFGQRVDEGLGPRRARRGAHELVAGVRAAVGDVLADGRREEERFVEHQPHRRAQAADGQVAHIPAVDQHRALGGVVEARQQASDGRLPAPRPADQCDRLTGSQVQVEVLQDGTCFAVAEGDVAQLDLPARVDQVHGPGPIDDLGLGVEDLVDPIGGGGRALAQQEHEPEGAERRLEQHDVGRERDDRPDGDGAVDGEEPAVEEHGRQAQPRQGLHQRARSGRGRRPAGSSPTGAGGRPARGHRAARPRRRTTSPPGRP